MTFTEELARVMEYEVVHRIKGNDKQNGYIQGLGMAIKIAREHNNWIPVSERLPEEREKVLTCDEDGCQEVCEYSCGGWWVVDEYSVDVIAWQPLPEPYKGE